MTFHILSQILITTIAATSLMTLFSYVVSASARELYKEPVLLTYLLSSLKIEVSPQIKTFLAWLLHYIIGLLFVLIYHYLWVYDLVEMSWPAAFVLGAASGVIGIFGWILLFKIVPQKPNINFKGYYVQLFFAHIIFGVVAFLVYKLFI
ncbi:hypothetical protein [Flavobacterium sp. Root420]|uniref:hypothetical protein n=1 Tax=Flavobacterium sp. Root420 TaxID=1736533 RepID=UPI0006FDCBE4|nr:hypothetical protein [Flavobacterium sp. Root420]KQW99599.1 hypothetical protein ASC72_11145 [Flavobacterium sp. Root420]